MSENRALEKFSRKFVQTILQIPGVPDTSTFKYQIIKIVYILGDLLMENIVILYGLLEYLG
jgi:hypothetical protein